MVPHFRPSYLNHRAHEPLPSARGWPSSRFSCGWVRLAAVLDAPLLHYRHGSGHRCSDRNAMVCMLPGRIACLEQRQMSEQKPIVGHIDLIDRGRIQGWAADKQNPGRQVMVKLFSGTRVIGNAVADAPRDDLKSAFEGSTGRYGFTLHLDPPLSMWEPHHIKVVADEHYPLGGAGIIRTPGTVLMPRRPLIVSSSGRAGSSLLMSRLKSHPEILVAGNHPYEIKMLSYFALSIMLHSAEADRVNSLDPDKMGLPENRYLLGRNPFN